MPEPQRYWQPALVAWITFGLSLKWLGWRGLITAVIAFFVGAGGTVYNGVRSGVIDGSSRAPR